MTALLKIPVVYCVVMILTLGPSAMDQVSELNFD